MLPKTIPDKLPGSVQPQYVRCGNPDCRCVRGELHGPYWYRFWRDETGRLRKEYVRLADLEKVRAACAAMRAEARWARAAVAVGTRTVDALLRPPGTPPTMMDDALSLSAEQFLGDLIGVALSKSVDPGLRTQAARQLARFLYGSREPGGPFADAPTARRKQRRESFETFGSSQLGSRVTRTMPACRWRLWNIVSSINRGRRFRGSSPGTRKISWRSGPILK